MTAHQLRSMLGTTALHPNPI